MIGLVLRLIDKLFQGIRKLFCFKDNVVEIIDKTKEVINVYEEDPVKILTNAVPNWQKKLILAISTLIVIIYIISLIAVTTIDVSPIISGVLGCSYVGIVAWAKERRAKPNEEHNIKPRIKKC
jgi:hypothetical protein